MKGIILSFLSVITFFFACNQFLNRDFYKINKIYRINKIGVSMFTRLSVYPFSPPMKRSDWGRTGGWVDGNTDKWWL
jgi:hypothetical protein